MELWHEGEKQTEKWKKDFTVLISVGSKHEVLIYVLLIFFPFFFEFERIIYFFFLSLAGLYSVNLDIRLTQ